MAYEHGITTKEVTASVSSEKQTSGIHVVIGVAPINLAQNPYGVTNMSAFSFASQM